MDYLASVNASAMKRERTEELFRNVEELFDYSNVRRLPSVSASEKSLRGDLEEASHIAQQDTRQLFKADSDDDSIPYVASQFTDADCGEPMISQKLRINFTPVEGVDDNVELQKKCIDFWRFVGSEPRLQGLMVLPERYEELAATECSSSECTSSEASLEKQYHVDTTGIEWLQTELGHSTVFASKQQPKYCEDRAEPSSAKSTSRLADKKSFFSGGNVVYDTLDKVNNNDTKTDKRVSTIKINEFETLRLNFKPTPEDDVDTEKCIKLWNMIYKGLEMKKRGIDYSKDVEGITERDIISTNDVNAFSSDVNKENSEEVCDEVVHKAIKGPLKSDISRRSQFQSKSRTLKANAVKAASSSSSLDAADLCAVLEEWDSKHPKCIEPPGREPKLTHAVMQRKISCIFR